MKHVGVTEETVIALNFVNFSKSSDNAQSLAEQLSENYAIEVVTGEDEFWYINGTSRPYGLRVPLKNKGSINMTGSEIVLLYSVGGSIAFIIALKIFKVEFAIWEAVLACISAAAIFVPNIGTGVGSLVAMLVVFKVLNKSSWENIWLPVVAARLALVPIGMMFTR